MLNCMQQINSTLQFLHNNLHDQFHSDLSNKQAGVTHANTFRTQVSNRSSESKPVKVLVSRNASNQSMGPGAAPEQEDFQFFLQKSPDISTYSVSLFFDIFIEK